MELHLYTDGGARGNPGIAGYGFAIFDQDKKLLHKDSQFLGVKTNNEAEYLGIIAALTWVTQNLSTYNPDSVHLFSDSQLIVRQLQGLYKVKSPNLKPFFATAQNLISQIKVPLTFNDIRREYNKLADSLANEAMDRQK